MEAEVTREKALALSPKKGTAPATIVFITLQFLDLITTLAVFSRGGVELNPIIRSLMPWTGRSLAIVLSKATILAVVLLLNRRKRVLRFANVLYVAVVIWNIGMFIALKQATSP
jgi:Domain of unknown function (DUF5658)